MGLPSSLGPAICGFCVDHLIDVITATQNSRVVTVSSMAHRFGRLPLTISSEPEATIAGWLMVRAKWLIDV